MEEEGGLCLVCCYSFPPPPPPEENNYCEISPSTTLSTFAKQVTSEDDEAQQFEIGELNGLTVCPECLSQISVAVGKREAVDEMEVQVRHLQHEILRLMRSLEGLVGKYLEEMRGIRDKIEGGDEAVLRSQRRVEEGDAVWALRSGVGRLVEQLGRRRPSTSSLSTFKAEEITVKVEPLLNEEEEEHFRAVEEEDLLSMTDSIFGETDGKAEAEREPTPRMDTPPTTRTTRHKSHHSSDPVKKKRKLNKSLKPEATTTIPPSSRVFPKNHCPEWSPWKPLLPHKKNSSRRKTYLCLSCPEVKYRLPYQLEQHLREHENSISIDTPPRPCPHCPLTFHHPQYWEYHVLCHEGFITAFCDCCPGAKGKLNLISLESHLRGEHQVEKVLQCPNCLFCCGKPDTYLEHLRRWHVAGKGVQGCYLCPATFKTPSELCQHLHQEHNALQPLICPHPGCGKQFLLEDALKLHQNLHLEKFVCSECSRKFETAWHLKKHTEVVHQGRRWHCRHCAKELTSAFSLKTHEELCGDSEKVAKWQCHLCEKAFRQEGTLKGHLRWHAGQVFCCDQCDVTFVNKGDLNRHRKVKHPDPSDPPVVEEQPRLPCEICGATLSNKGKLKRHLRIHEDDRKWACDVCGKTFREKYYLTCHQMTHSTERQFACDICGKAYSQPAGLYQHRRSAHGGVAAKDPKK